MQKRSRGKLNNRGSAMLVAIIVSMIVIAFGFSLLLVSYSLFASSVRQSTQTQCRELTKTISTELEQEITTPMYGSYAEQDEAGKRGEAPLWFYLRENMKNADWPYYAPERPYHTEEYAFRYFTLDVHGAEESEYTQMADDISICMYWSPDDATSPDERDNTILTIVVTCRKGDTTCTIISNYTLTVTEYTDATTSGSEAWSFALEERE